MRLFALSANLEVASDACEAYSLDKSEPLDTYCEARLDALSANFSA